MQEPNAYSTFLSRLTERIHTAQIRAALALNQKLISLYWQIGQLILEQEKQGNWNDKAVGRLSRNLKRNFPNANEFSPQELGYMRALAEAYPDEKLVQQAFIHIPWEHNRVILKDLDSQEQRAWYARKAIKHGWSHNILAIQIESNRFGRQTKGDLDFEQTLPPRNSDMSRQLLENQRGLSLLGLQETVKEATLKQALVNHIRDFLLGLRAGFGFVGSQYRLDVGKGEFFVDLLFYHVVLRRYVAITVETTDFEPEFVGKMNFFVNVIDDMMAGEKDKPTIGIILCKSKNKAIAEYTLDSTRAPISVSTYSRQEELPDLSNGLPTVQQLEAELELAVHTFKSQDTEQLFKPKTIFH